MFNKCFGVQGDFSLDFFKSKEDISSANYFKAVNFRFSAEFVWNIGRTYHFEKKAPNLSLLATLGGGPSSLRDARTDWWKSWRHNYADEKLNFVFGVVGQYRLNERIVLYAQSNVLAHYHQDADFNFGSWYLDPKKIHGFVFNCNAGVSYYLGKHAKHVDWYVEPKKEVPILKEEPVIDTLLVVKFDRDRDEIPDSLDVCPDVKGLPEFFGCPDQEVITNCELQSFPLILFDVSSTVIARSYKASLDSLANCMKYYQTQKYLIHGYSDNVGDPISIDDIAYRRALNVKRELTQRGIDKERLLALGEGAERPKIEEDDLKKVQHNRLAYFEVISNNAYDIIALNDGQSLQGLFYTIQVASLKKNSLRDDLEQYGRVLYSKSPDNIMQRYSIGVYHSSEEASNALAELKRKGLFPDAFVTAYYLGERITNKKGHFIYLEKGKEVLEPKGK